MAANPHLHGFLRETVADGALRETADRDAMIEGSGRPPGRPYEASGAWDLTLLGLCQCYASRLGPGAVAALEAV